MLKGVILKGIGGFYYVSTENGVYECKARGVFRKDKITPTVGDFVEIEVLDEEEKKGSLDVIKDRKNELIRPKVANVEQAVIVFSITTPKLNLDLLDRFIVLASEQNLDILICINKIDLDEKNIYPEVEEIYKIAGYKIISISTYKNINIDNLRQHFKNKISVFAGPSGVGKSSIINSISPNLNVLIGEISAKLKRGKHTTRHSELLSLDENSFVVDSPGFTSLDLTHIDKDDLKLYYKEFAEFSSSCKFNTCSHTHEPGCAVKENVNKGISEERYNRYVYFYNELANERKK